MDPVAGRSGGVGGSTPRRIVIRSLAVVGLLLLGFLLFMVTAESAGLIQSVRQGDPGDPPPSEEAEAGAEAPGESMHLVGGLALIVIGGSGLIGLVAAPERRGIAVHVAAVMTGILVSALITGDPDNVGGMAGPIDPLFVIVALPGLAGATLAKPWQGPPPTLRPVPILALAVFGAIPIAWYGFDQGLIQRNTFPPSADPHHNAHWWAMSTLAFSGLLTLAAAGLGLRGWRIGATAVGLAGVAFGVASSIAPGAASAVPLPWSIAVAVWGLAVLAAEIRSRGEPPRP